ncbi:SIS domain-containing protein [Aliivibrio fischeri]|uniref:SIS domain-containing protein n=1 Tax=Aliivibrio fischeri TaxID=668 RepID=A0A1B9PC97_ALIFS|nr:MULTISPECIES: SIS domain-containing protein [Aliivibrio]MBD1567862.1 SIS domain-containing protein [Aliivibrio sp. S10_S31]MBP3141676.1 SIS domain-containing protein [Aliivibrio fischeri]MBP3157705.1 SIS domain-containing protein [Aliivibrio fischeri]MCE4934249.1 SIS domain-containing protein [Aliivibrio fischeri]MCE7534659.1 SIS domain-containing protein [Aliivibrio fischeri]
MNILEKIQNQRSNLSSNGIKILDFILDDPASISSYSSQALAAKVGVSQSSIVKLTQRLGFKGFTAFKLAIIEDLGRKQAILEPERPIHNKINSDDSSLTIAQKLVQEKTHALIATTNAINFSEFELITTLLNQAQRIQIVGIGGSALTAKDLAFKLLKIGMTALTEQDSHVQIATANTLTKQDVQIVISYSGSRKEILMAAQTAMDKGATVIALTSTKKSPLRKLANFCIDTIADERQFRSSSISSRTAQNVITDLLFMTLLQIKSDKAKLLIDEISSTMNRI